MKILVADADEAVRLNLQALLTQWGHEVVVARDGTEAWQWLQRDDAPSLALLDSALPPVDGVEICRRMKQSPKAAEVYIVMLSNGNATHDLARGLGAGADDYLSKPLIVEELQIRLRAAERIVSLQQALWFQGTHDALSGALNRGAILETLQRELVRAEREGTAIAVVLADLDHLRKINDSRGRPAGDAVLRETAKRLRAPLRLYDALGRYGGEEFLIVLPACEPPNVLQVAERMRHSVASASIDVLGAAVAVTVSLGTAAAPNGDCVEADEMVRAAHEALERAKRSGRNRVEGTVLGN